MDDLSFLKEKPILYVTRDIERALGIPLNTEGFSIMTNSSPVAKPLAEQHDNVMTIEAEHRLSTRELLDSKELMQYMKKHKDTALLLFKSNSLIERLCKKKKWNLLNPPATVASQAEEKISQVAWLGDLASSLPAHEIKPCGEVEWKGTPFILQFNHAHTGTGTALIDSEEDLLPFKKQFPKRPARLSSYIPGPILTNNNVVTSEKILVGNIAYQITGLAPFTDNPFATIGNDWSFPKKLLTKDQYEQYIDLVEKIGIKLRASGWKGLFGVDVVLNEKTGTLSLIEINARQPASTTFESELQREARNAGASGYTTFEAHLLALQDKDLTDAALIEIPGGAQIVQRVTKYKKRMSSDERNKFVDLGMQILEPGEMAMGKELFILRSRKGLMASHGVLNDIGKKLL